MIEGAAMPLKIVETPSGVVQAWVGQKLINILNAGNVQSQAALLCALADHPALAPVCSHFIVQCRPNAVTCITSSHSMLSAGQEGRERRRWQGDGVLFCWICHTDYI